MNQSEYCRSMRCMLAILGSAIVIIILAGIIYLESTPSLPAVPSEIRSIAIMWDSPLIAKLGAWWSDKEIPDEDMNDMFYQASRVTKISESNLNLIVSMIQPREILSEKRDKRVIHGTIRIKDMSGNIYDGVIFSHTQHNTIMYFTSGWRTTGFYEGPSVQEYDAVLSP